MLPPEWSAECPPTDKPWFVSHELDVTFVERANEPVSDSRPEVLLHSLVSASTRRHQDAAEEYRLIALVLDGAVDDPEPWVGRDTALDLDEKDSRGRSAAAARRDRADVAERAAVAEIAVQLRLSEQTVRIRAGYARTLRSRCALAWRAFRGGRISESHAVKIARLADSLPDDRDALHAFDRGATERAQRLSPARFDTAARVLRERVHAESIEERHRRAAHDRGVWVTPELDGMATLTALLPADRAYAVLSRLDRVARHLASAAGEERTMAQLRADSLADLIVAGVVDHGADAPDTPNTPATTSAPRPAPARPTILVTVPALTLLGQDDTPAILDGYGPIDLDTARRLAGDATSWVRVLTHPVSGVPLTLDRTRYRVTTALRRWLGVTSPTCIFPGCGRPARECDIDHLTPWAAGGTTDDDNLAPECRHHHRLRHESRWEPVTDPATGSLGWRSPLGHEVEVDPPPF